MVAQSCPTLCGPLDCSSPGSSVCGFLQARILAWGAIPFSSISELVLNWKVGVPVIPAWTDILRIK